MATGKKAFTSILKRVVPAGIDLGGAARSGGSEAAASPQNRLANAASVEDLTIRTRNRLKLELKHVLRANNRAYGASATENPPPQDMDAIVDELIEEVGLFVDWAHMLPQPIRLLVDRGETSCLVDPQAQIVEGVIDGGQPVTVELETARDPIPSLFELESLNDERVEGVYIVLNGQDWRDTDAIRNSFFEGLPDRDYSAEERSLVIQRGVRNGLDHLPKITERDGDAAQDPVAMFNVFGGSTCGVLSQMMGLFLKQEGMDLRLLRTQSHTFAEVEIDDRARVLDADPLKPPFYLHPEDPSRLLAAGDIGELIGEDLKNYRHPLPETLLVDTETDVRRAESLHQNFVNEIRPARDTIGSLEDPDRPRCDVGMVLMPREKLTWKTVGNGVVYRGEIPLPNLGGDSNMLVREVDFLAGAHRYAGFDRARVLETETGAEVLFEAGGSVSFEIDTAFPVLDALIKLSRNSAETDPAPKLTCTIERDGAALCTVGPSSIDARSVRFRLRRGTATARFGQKLRVTLRSEEPADFSELRIVSTCQVARRLVPSLLPGRNRIEISTSGTAGKATRWAYRYRFTPGDAILSATLAENHAPGDGQDCALEHFDELNWLPGLDQEPDAMFEVQMALDPDFIYLAPPNFNRYKRGSRLPITEGDKALLHRGATYHWRVRQVGDKGRPLTDWSPTLKFTLT